jgi:GNAT superfamily N-acetyltransferase
VIAGPEAARAADAIEAAAYADLYAAAPPPLAAGLGLAVHEVGGATVLVAARIPAPMFNRAIGLGWQQPATPASVETIAAHYRAAGVANWWLHWNPFATPAGFDAELQHRGFALPPRSRWAKVMRDAAGAPRVETALAIVRTEDAPATAAAIAQAFEMPPVMADWLAALHGRPRWQLYSVLEGERVVGGGALFVSGAAAWLGMGAVLPAWRKRGGQRALMARRIADAAAAGAERVFTETGEPVGDEPNPSLANMRASGFETVASRLNLAAPMPA